MYIDFLMRVFSEHKESPAIIWQDKIYSYEWLGNKVNELATDLKSNTITPKSVVGLTGDFSPCCIALLLALIENENIVVPFASAASSGISRKLGIAQVEHLATVNDNEEISFQSTQVTATHELYSTVRCANQPGLVLFTSGTSGEPKAAVHLLPKLLTKFETKRTALRTVNFLLFDHWGGLNTLFHTLSNNGVVLAIRDRSPDGICQFIEKHQIELLPASPTFLNLLLLSEAYKRHDLGSLKVITYGTEPMPLSTLRRVNTIFPEIKLQQTYGLIELGVLRSKSRGDNSLWVKVGGDGYTTRVVDGILQIKADSAMLGYLNAPSPFTDDGFFITGDAVEVDGEYLTILGRKSELINIGGDKVYPAEVESVIQEMSNVAEVTIYGEKNPLIGNIVCAKVRLLQPEDQREFTRRLKQYCTERLQRFMVPVKVNIVDETQVSERQKKKRFN